MKTIIKHSKNNLAISLSVNVINEKRLKWACESLGIKMGAVT